MFSLRTKILTIVLAFVAVLGIAFILYSMFTTANYKQLRLEGIANMVDFKTERVNKTIAEIERVAIFFAQAGYLSYKLQLDEVGESLVVEHLNSFPTAIGGGFWYEPYAYNKNKFRAGFYAFFDKEIGEIRLDDTFVMKDYDYHNLSWYREVLANATEPFKVVWTKPYVDDTGSFTLMTTAGAGIFNENGRLIGISDVDWEIDAMVMDLSRITPTENTFVLIYDPLNDYIISNTYDQETVGDSPGSLSWNVNANSFVLNDVTYMTFRRIMDNGWRLSVQIPENEIFAEVERRNDRFSLIIAFSSVLLLCLAFLLISKTVNTPLKHLTEGVAQLGIGNLDVRIDIETNDELGLLANTFNKMTVDLQKSVENAARERAEKERISTELDVATKIQAGLLPCIFPAFPERSEFDIYASMLPAKEVGGDFYDFFLIGPDHLAIVIADVSGKGVPAALFMVIAKTLIKNLAVVGMQPAEVFEAANNMLCENNEVGMFVTAFMGVLEISGGKFTYVNAGHNPPLIKQGDGDYNWLSTKPGFVLAGMEGMRYVQTEITLQKGDALFLYTDGVTEAVNTENMLFTDPKLLADINKHKHLPLTELLPTIKQEIDSFADGAEQADDITMLGLIINE